MSQRFVIAEDALLNMETQCSSETSVRGYKTTDYHNSEDHNTNTVSCRCVSYIFSEAAIVHGLIDRFDVAQRCLRHSYELSSLMKYSVVHHHFGHVKEDTSKQNELLLPNFSSWSNECPVCTLLWNGIPCSLVQRYNYSY